MNKESRRLSVEQMNEFFMRENSQSEGDMADTQPIPEPGSRDALLKQAKSPAQKAYENRRLKTVNS